MTQYILDLMSKRRMYKNNNLEKYKQMQQKITEAIRQAKEKWMEEQCAEIEELIKKHDHFNLHKKLKEAGNIYRPAPTATLYADNNQPILNKQEKMETWTNYIHKLFGATRTPAEKDQQTSKDALHILTSEVEHAI